MRRTITATRRAAARANPGRPGRRPTRTLLSALLLLLSLGSLGLAQPESVDPAAAKKRFFDGLKAAHAHQRIAAVEALARTGLPQAMGWMQTALDRTVKSRDKHHKRYEELGKKLNEVIPYKYPVNQDLPRSTIRKMQQEKADAQALLQRDEKVIKALEKSMGEVYGKLSADGQADSVAPILRRLSGARKTPERTALVGLLGHLKGDRVREALRPLVGDKDPEVRIAAIEALARQADASATAAVAEALTDPFWQVRASAIDALGKIGGAEAVDALVLAVGKVEGRLLDDVIKALIRLTGQNFHENKVLWQNWWTKNRSTYKPPPRPGEKEGETDPFKDDVELFGKKKEPGKKKPKEAAPPSGEWRDRTQGTTFYGIRTRSKRLVYILDISNSMNMSLGAASPAQTGRVIPGPIGHRKIDQAIEELKRSITSLPEDATFNIVFYNHEIDVWRKGQVKATAKNKKKALEWADRVKADGNTNIFDALERAFKLAGRGTFDPHYPIAADTFYLLSDGRSNRGRVVGGGAMRQEVGRLNKFRKVVIHTIALGEDADIKFMNGLAQDTGGEFVHHGVRGKH